jgi:isocitrate dehydrogenase
LNAITIIILIKHEFVDMLNCVKVKYIMKIDIVYIEGDGIGASINGVPGVSELAGRVMEAAVQKAYGDQHSLNWIPGLAGDAARRENFPELSDEDVATRSEKDQQEIYLPKKTLDLIESVGLALKGPLTTPVGGGFRSINVALRQIFDLYACIRPVHYIKGIPAPNRNAKNVNMTVFRENVEDVYAGIEFEAGSSISKQVNSMLGAKLRPDWSYGIGVKPISEQGSKRLIRKAIQYAIDHKYPSVTLMHKGNIMKFTEGAFMKWGLEIAKDEFADQVIAESDLHGQTEKIIIKDRIADSMFQQVQLRPEDYGVIATTNLNGDYISDALAAMVGGLGFAPGANIGEKIAIFEATHGTAPKYSGQDKANPGSVILSGALLLDHVGLGEAAQRIRDAVKNVVKESAERASSGSSEQLFVTYDIARQFEGRTAEDGAKASAFADRVIQALSN